MTATVAQRKTKTGRVVSDKMDKTIVVSVERLARHRLYKRVIRVTTRFKAHDETNTARIGDTVLIEESRPLSATKRWRLVDVLVRADEAQTMPIVSEEAETSEAIHGAAHPGRGRADAEAAVAEAAVAEAAVAEAAAEAGVEEAAVEEQAADTPAVEEAG